MQPQLTLGRIFGISIGLHYSWLIIAVLITLTLRSIFHDTNDAWPDGMIWAASILTALLFFVSIVVHELAHALVARSRGLPVRSITLFALGGMAQIERDAADPPTEFWMGIAGPLMSVAIGLLCIGIAVSAGWTSTLPPDTPAVAVMLWLGYINFMLAAFNMIPGFPLDGGRVLRAILWWTTGSADRATRIAARIGQGVGFVLIVFGLFRFLEGAGLGGLWMSLIGWFLLEAARASVQMVQSRAELQM